MTLTVDQKDAVTELVNIAFSRTAAALAELTGNRVELTVPEVSAHPIAPSETRSPSSTRTWPRSSSSTTRCASSTHIRAPAR